MYMYMYMLCTYVIFLHGINYEVNPLTLRMALLVLVAVLLCMLCDWVDAVLPAYSPALEGLIPADIADIFYLLFMYFKAGYTIPVICSFLLYRHGIQRSVRHLKRMLKKLGVKRKQQHSNPEDIISGLLKELSGSGSCCGYRSMRQRLVRDHNRNVTQHTVRRLLLALDPEGVHARKHRRLRWRTYSNKGPNYLIHIDGYDKLKPYGFAIHGAIDGFSRKILWLEVGPTNNNPRVIATYFVDYIRQMKAVPHLVRSDRGTENTIVKDIQVAFRFYHDDERSRFKSFLYGKSTSNQRIERWWGSMRSGAIDYWLRLFKDMIDHGILDNSCPWQIECMRFCFTPLLRSEIHRVGQLWNEHHIRHSKNAEGPAGKPDQMFFLPQLYGTRDYKHEVSMVDVDDVESEYCEEVNAFGCSPDFQDLAETVMRQKGYGFPATAEEAVLLFSHIKDAIEND